MNSRCDAVGFSPGGHHWAEERAAQSRRATGHSGAAEIRGGWGERGVAVIGGLIQGDGESGWRRRGGGLGLGFQQGPGKCHIRG